MDAPAHRIRVLIVEDDDVDRLACRRAFAKDPAHDFELLEADSGQAGLEIAHAQSPDCILLDYNLPDLTGLEFLARLGAAKVASAVMMLTGADSAAVAAEAMRRGALDYMVKDVEGRYLGLLPAAIDRMLREQRLVNDKLELEAKFRSLVEQVPAITYIAALGVPDKLLYISPQVRTLGYSPDEWMADPGLPLRQLHAEDRRAAEKAIMASRLEGVPLHLEYRLHTRDGHLRWFRDQAEVVCDDAGEPLFVQGIMVDITANKLAEEALRQSQDELRQLASHQESLKESERKRIAAEIHDELGGLLTGIKAYISVAIDRAAQAGKDPDPLLVETAGLAQSAIETVRRVITDLRPSVLDQLGIWAALEWYCDQVAQRTGLECVARIEPEAAAVELDPDSSTMLFRIAQEALTNAVRHADASRIEVSVGRHGGQLELAVADNGKGIDTDGLLDRESWGILGMHERTRRFDGELKITGTPGKGTTLRLRLPVRGEQ